jgi:choline monooxygenase
VPWFGEDPEFNLQDWPLEEIHVDQWRGLVFIAFNPLDTLVDQLGSTIDELSDVPMEDYKYCEEHRLSFDSNWKIYTDNFVEGYHIPGIHPEFFAAIDFDQFETTSHDGLVKMTAPANRDLFYKGRWYWMWPNWTLSLFSGGMNTSRINPLSHNKTELVYHFYFEDASEGLSAKHREDTISRNLEVVRQDFQICLETHNNYEAGSYQPGPLSSRHETGVAYFQEKYLQAISAEQHL